MSANIFVLWRDPDAYHFVDILPEAILLGPTTATPQTIEHKVRGPSGEPYGIAVCKVHVASNYTDLDYGGTARDANERAGMDIGIMRCELDQSGQITISWKPDGAADFSAAQAVALRGSELKILCKAVSASQV